MKIRKETPSWFIVADSKINVQSLGKYSEHLGFDYETQWIKANGKAQQVSQAEKLLELLAIDFLGIPNDKPLPNNEYLVANFNRIKALFDHFSVTIVFNEVSHVFVQNLFLEKLANYHINQKRYNDMSLWLPPAFEHPIVGSIFGQMVGDCVGNVERFIATSQENGVKPEDALKTAFSMMPMAQHSKIVVTASMSNWRQVLVNLSQFDKDIETRYIITHLCRDLKLRYFGFLSDLVLQTQDGKVYGLDSIGNEGFWKQVKIATKTP
jgi:hypothetical protein